MAWPLALLLAASLAAACLGCGTELPHAENASIALDEDDSVTFRLSARDDNDDPLQWEIVASPRFGTLDTAEIPRVTYTPDPDFFGSDAFTFRVNDGTADSNLGIVRITVNGLPDPPIATPHLVTTPEDHPVTFTLPGRDPDGDEVTFTIVTLPGHGTLDTDQLPRVTYTPDLDYHGADSLTYRLSDGVLESEIATLPLEIVPVPDLPFARSQEVTTPEDVPIEITLDGADPDGGEPAVFLLTAPVHGVLRAVSLPTVVYTPDQDYAGRDAFTFVVYNGELVSQPATVSITVTPVNDPPRISDVALVTTEDNPLELELPVIDPDTPPELLQATLLTLPRNGRLFESWAGNAISARDLPLVLDGLSLYYVPPANYFSPGSPPLPESFDIAVTDEEYESQGPVYLVVMEGGILYVSIEGDDMADGRTTRTALRTISTALRRTDVVSPTEKPDRILLDAGRYCEAGLEITHNVNVSGVGMEEVVIDGIAKDGVCPPISPEEDTGSLMTRCENRAQTDWPDEGIFHISGSGATPLTVEMADLTIANGFNRQEGGAIFNTERLTLNRVWLVDNCSLTYGGAVANGRPELLPPDANPRDWGATLLSESIVEDNSAFRGGGLHNLGSLGLMTSEVTGNEAGMGGAIYSRGGGIEEVDDVVYLRGGSSVSWNQSVRHGGGLYVDRSEIVIMDSSIIGNTAGALVGEGRGGGVYAVGDPGQRITIIGSFINRNHAPYCGGLCSDGYDVEIGQSQINDNHAQNEFGGGYIAGILLPKTMVDIFGDTEVGGNDSDGDYAGLTLDTVDTAIIGAVFRDNIALNWGGGLTIWDSRALLEQVEFYGNMARIGGGALVEGASLLELRSVDIYDNTATELGGGLAQTNGATYLFDTTTVTRNRAVSLDAQTDSKIQRGGGIGAIGGAIFVDGAQITNNETSDWGGGIFTEAAQLDIRNNALIGSNQALSFGGDLDFLDGALPSGGGVYLTGGDLTLNFSTLAGNRAEVAGGGLFATYALVLLESSTLSENSCHALPDSGADQRVQRGGGFHLDGTQFLVVDSSIRGNYSADQGAGGYIRSGEGGIVRSTISGNAASAGDDPSGDAPAEGGGLYISAAEFGIINSTLSGNWADWKGGAILGADSDIDLFYCTVFDNGTGSKGALSDQDSDWVFHATVIATNIPGGDCDAITPVSAYSLDSDNSCRLGGLDLTQDDPKLDPELADNGGVTLTHAILADSPLIDQVPEEECLFQLDAFMLPHTDQRGEGFARPVGGGCDVGAFERQ
ncbi:MAG: tandem-95 repeat protein [Bradymonadales bacterium]|nr:tandem-95 repeat protein [Bradymonadales bacterium]